MNACWKHKTKLKYQIWGRRWCNFCTCAPGLVFNWKLNFSQTQVNLKNWARFLAEKRILVKLKSNSKNWGWLSICAPVLVLSWQLDCSETQVKLKKLSLNIQFLRNSKKNQKIEFDFVHVVWDWFLAENWILFKLKSNSRAFWFDLSVSFF